MRTFPTIMKSWGPALFCTVRTSCSMDEASLICRPLGLDPTILEARILPGPLFLVLSPQPQLPSPPGRAEHTPLSSIHDFAGFAG